MTYLFALLSRQEYVRSLDVVQDPLVVAGHSGEQSRGPQTTAERIRLGVLRERKGYLEVPPDTMPTTCQ